MNADPRRGQPTTDAAADDLWIVSRRAQPGEGRERHADRDIDSTSYVVAGALGEDALTGEAAAKFFAGRPLVELGVSIWCH